MIALVENDDGDPQFQRAPIRVVWAPDNIANGPDIAVVHAEVGSLEAFKLANEPPGTDDQIVTGGWPIMHLQPDSDRSRLSAGRILSVTRRDAMGSFPAFVFLRHDAPLLPGDSGAPVLDRKGRLLGVNSRVSVDVSFWQWLVVTLGRTPRQVDIRETTATAIMPDPEWLRQVIENDRLRSRLHSNTAPIAGAGDLQVRIIDVGQRHAAVAKMPGVNESGEQDDFYMAYDTGRWEDWERQATLEVIRQVIPSSEDIDLMVLSHADEDHIGGVPEILDAYKVKRIIRLGENATRGRDSIWTWRNADQAIKSEGADLLDLSEQDIASGTRYQFGETSLTLVSGFSQPPEDWGELSPSQERNAGSIVIRLEFRGKSVLFSGDAVGCESYELEECGAPIATEKYMYDNSGTVEIESNVLIAPHHGSQGSSSPKFIASVAPEWVVFPAGHGRFELPRTVTAERYIKAEIAPAQILRTDRGDHEGPKEWFQGRIKGRADVAYDDHIDIVITADGELRVGYSQPNPSPTESCNQP